MDRLTKNQISRLAYLSLHRPYSRRHSNLIERITRAHRQYQQWQDRLSELSALAAKKTTTTAKTVRQQCADMLRKRMGAELRDAWYMAGLRMATGAWAGGDNRYTVAVDAKITAPTINSTPDRVWSRNGKWSGLDMSAVLWIAPSMRFAAISGVISIYRRGADLRNGSECWWIEQSRGMATKIVSGYIVRGNHLKAKSLSAAQKRVAAQRSAAARDAWKRRIAERHHDEVLARTWVSREDSIAAGNCAVGTDSFCSKLSAMIGGEIGAMRATALIDAAKTIGQMMFVERAINKAMHRYA